MRNSVVVLEACSTAASFKFREYCMTALFDLFSGDHGDLQTRKFRFIESKKRYCQFIL